MTDSDLGTRVAEIQRGYVARADQNYAMIQRVMRYTQAMLVLVVIILGAGGFFTMYSLNQNASLTHRVSDQRVQAILQTCNDGNARHDRTVARIRALVQREEVTLTSSAKRALQVQEASTLSIINDLQPRFNCQQRLRELSKVIP